MDTHAHRRSFFRHWLPAVCCLLTAGAGCRLAPARVSSTDPDHPCCSRSLLLARQVAADSAVELARHPLRCGRNLVVETGEHLAAAGAGLAVKRVGLSTQGPPGPVCPASPSPLPIDECARPAQIELYPDPCQALLALRGAIDQASERLDVLMFLWENDEVGATVARWLTEKAACGVRVRVLVDGGGNLIFSPMRKGLDVNGVVCTLARQPNVEVIRLRNPFCRFDHRKLVLVDGRRAWTGGRNFTHKSFFGQRDLSFTVVGPLVDDLQACFEQTWQEQGGEPAPPGPLSLAVDQGPATTANAWARLVHTGPDGHHLAAELYAAVDGARQSVYLENGYLSDPRLICKLAAARRRGVDVRVVMTVNSHEEMVDRANRMTVNRLLAAGVRVYLCPQMTHVKAGIVDSCWAYLGTGNYDTLSLRHNCEFGLFLRGPLVGALEECLFADAFCPDWELHEPLPTTVKDFLGEFVMCLFL